MKITVIQVNNNIVGVQNRLKQIEEQIISQSQLPKSQVQDLVQEITQAMQQQGKIQEDKVVEVLVDGPSKKDPTVLSGYSRENKLVNFKGDAKEGDIVNVLIDNPMSFSLNGIQVK